MDDTDGALSFDFEGGLDSAAPASVAPAAAAGHLTTPDPTAAAANAGVAPPIGPADQIGGAAGNGHGRRSFRQTVCRHWLRGLCMKGEACGFLHQYDKERMPVCRFFRLYGECREQDCVYKHTNEDIKECNMYKLGFCPNGPDCRYRHLKMPGPPPPIEEVFQKIQHLSSFGYGSSSNRFYQHRSNNYNQQPDKNHLSSASGLANATVKLIPLESSDAKAPESLGVWATQRSNEAKLNEAFESTENVILIFSINKTRHFQGCAKMTSRIGGYIGGGNWKYSHGTAHYGRNFSLKWLKIPNALILILMLDIDTLGDHCRFQISRDCQELEPFIGDQLASLLYLEPDSELMAMLAAAESKREEEKAKGVGIEEARENPDIPQIPFVRGGRPMLGVRGFPPMMMGADGFGFGDGFSTPDMYGPRIFPPFGGPRFAGDFSGGMVFPGRPLQPGAVFPMGNLGMMMGPGRPPFMGGMPMGGIGRANRPVGVPPFLHPPLSNNRAAKRDHRRPANDRYESGSDQGNRGQEMVGTPSGVDDDAGYWQGGDKASDDKYTAGRSFQNDESESEDEMAPRRSRHTDGKRKHGGSEGEAALN
ncbi:hypothetical protein ZIOFF_043039 [Zingiber officinale]|uniref:Uncharacterized protein n=1 Tax=Zingiber officinale TaxID=94328 RepID=A0A8J5FSK8_ZINOF|nr:hypothetical protein ZIOFF_043039 [Zingiber officinale]